MDINWDNAPEWASYVAMDKDGTWHWYEHQPTILHQIWVDLGGRCVEVETTRWKDTLQQRPQE